MTPPIIITEQTGRHQTDNYPVGTTIWYLHPKHQAYQLTMIQYTGYRNYNSGFKIPHDWFWKHLHAGTFHDTIVAPLLASHGDDTKTGRPVGKGKTVGKREIMDLVNQIVTHTRMCNQHPDTRDLETQYDLWKKSLQ